MRLACYACHFGKEWIGYSVRNIRAAVDEVHVFYAPEPSYGFSTPGAVCPETEDEIHAEVLKNIGTTPLFWHRVTGTRSEGQHKDQMTVVAKERGAEAYILLDADELWDPQTATEVLDLVVREKAAARWTAPPPLLAELRLDDPDPFRPIRVVDVRLWDRVKEHHNYTPQAPDRALCWPTEQRWGVFHFGYAQCEATMRYKVTCHSHKAETDWPAWLDRVFFPWRPGSPMRDLHPTAPTAWPEMYRTPPEIKAKLVELMGDHPYMGRELIR